MTVITKTKIGTIMFLFLAPVRDSNSFGSDHFAPEGPAYLPLPLGLGFGFGLPGLQAIVWILK